ncbi:OST-HTH/LOTUS domain-containing protein [Microbacterium sp. NPDC019599]
MRTKHPDFDSRNWGYAKLSDLVREIGLFTVAPNPNGGVRVKNGGR